MKRMKMKMVCAAAMVTMASGLAGMAQDTTSVSTTAAGINLQTSVAMNVQYKAKDDLLAGTEKFAQGASKVTEINLDPSTIGMVGAYYGPGGNMAGKMKLMVVHTYQYDKPGVYRTEDVEGYVKKLQDGSWNCPVVSREKDRFSYICAKTDGDHETNEMVIFTAEPQKLTFIHMAGAMSFNDLSNMSDRAHGLARQVEPRGNFNPITVRPIVVPKVFVTPGTPATPTMPASPEQ